MLERKGLYYSNHFLSEAERKKAISEILSFHPIWEMRHSTERPLLAHQTQRRLLRPVYWLKNWQFACLGYFHPPKNIENCCVRGEDYPSLLGSIVHRIEELVRAEMDPRDVPRQWKLNTCLINYYGDSLIDGKWVDQARVGEHKDFEPGPVASLSFGEKALFQFVTSAGKQAQSKVVIQQWLEDNSLQVFAGSTYKMKLFHRVQRVERKRNEDFPINVPDFKVRRLNLTFRYVPDEYILPFSRLSVEAQKDVAPYVHELSKTSVYWKKLTN